jgi:hypothetical protein
MKTCFAKSNDNSCIYKILKLERQTGNRKLKFETVMMITFSATIQRFDKMGEKTGWMYIEINAQQARKLKPDTKVSFRVKGKLDSHPVEKLALLPMGEGSFILPVNASIRKATGKKTGDKLKVQLEVDDRSLTLSPDLMTCLKDEPVALANFKKLPKSHQQYYSKWIESAKTVPTKSKRISVTVMASFKGLNYSQMMREYKQSSEF